MTIRTILVFAALSGLVAGLFALPGCHASNAAGAVAMTSLAGGVSAVRRANGDCFVDCLPGTHCNRGTGLCDPLACDGACSAGFVCEETETGSSCVPRAQSSLAVSAPRSAPGRAQPFGDGQAAQGPAGAAALGNANGGAGSGSSSSAQGGSSVSTCLSDGGATAGSLDGGLSRAPAAALQAAPVHAKDVPANSSRLSPGWMESNPWDPRHADPLPQLDNPNQPPPH